MADSYTQNHARFYEADNDETSETAIAAQDTNITRTIVADNTLALRVSVNNTLSDLGGGD